jgi:hypothetical protein
MAWYSEELTMWEFLSEFTPNNPSWKDVARFAAFFAFVVFESVAAIYCAGLVFVK